MLGTGDAIWFSDGKGNPLVPPHNVLVAKGSQNAGIVDEVENPNPLKGTNNWYKEDGYGGGSYGSPSYGGGSYTQCADPAQPGVKAVVSYLNRRRQGQAELRPGALLPPEQLQPGLFRRRQQRLCRNESPIPSLRFRHRASATSATN